MNFKGTIAGAALLAGAFASTGPSQATVLLSLTDSTGQTTAYSLSFVADSTSTTVSIGGYQVPAWAYSKDNGLFQSGGTTNLLGANWTFTRAAKGSDSSTVNDGTSVPGLVFGGLTAGYYDTYSQTVTTTPGDVYTLDLLYTNSALSAPSGLLASEFEGPVTAGGGGGISGGGGILGGGSGGAATPGLSSGVPEPSTWALMLTGFLLIGFRGFRRVAEGVARVRA